MDRGQRVVGLDDFSTGKREHIQRIKQKHTNNFVFFEGSILNEELLGACFRQADIIVHLAAQVSVASSVENPIVNNETNVTGFLRILEAAAKSEAHALIYASSCAVYGDSFELPLKESQVPNPLSQYAVSKLVNEHYASCYSKLYPELKTVGLRFFNVFGPWQDADSGYAAVIPKWINLLLTGEKPVIYGDGGASRTFVLWMT